jgi:hypothetical protein
MIPQEIKTTIQFIYNLYLSKYMGVIITIVVLLILTGLSIIFFGKNNPIEEEIEKIIEKEITEIDPTSSSKS